MDKIIIEEDMVENISNMLKSPDEKTVNMIMTMLDNRDVTDHESENNYNKVLSMIIDKNKSFINAYPLYVIKFKGKILNVKGRDVFRYEDEAKKFLSYHLTSFIGSKDRHNFYYDKIDPYYKMLRRIFKSGIDMRNYVIKNKIFEIVQIQ